MKNSIRFSDEKKAAFHELMLCVQMASKGKLPRSIIHFMEEALEVSTKMSLLRLHDSSRLSADEIANAMYEIGYEVDHGSVESCAECFHCSAGCYCADDRDIVCDRPFHGQWQRVKKR